MLNSGIGAVITKITYDYDMKPEGDEFVALAEKSADTFSQAAAPGVWLVDIFPSCMSIAISRNLFLTHLVQCNMSLPGSLEPTSSVLLKSGKRSMTIFMPNPTTMSRPLWLQVLTTDPLLPAFSHQSNVTSH
jgi:hypothetical protein